MHVCIVNPSVKNLMALMVAYPSMLACMKAYTIAYVAAYPSIPVHDLGICGHWPIHKNGFGG